MVEFSFPLRTISLTNVRMHWSQKAKIAKDQRRIVWAEWLRNVKNPIALPCVITFTRIAPRALDGHDNLTSSFKHCVDEAAKMLGVDDRDSRIEWRYAQMKGEPKYYGVRVQIEEVANGKNWKDGKGR